MLRAEIRLVEFGQVQAREPAHRRPAMIVSNDGANSMAGRLGQGVITVVPTTSNVTRVHPFQVLVAADVSGLERDSKAQAEQVRSVSVERAREPVGSVPAPLMLGPDETLRFDLAL
jgi:mRNA interferase MazF